MGKNLRGAWIGVVAVSSIATVVMPAASQRATDRPLPYELAFAHNLFPWQEDPAVSADGRSVASSVITPVATNRDARYQPNGTPSSAVGSRILLLTIRAGVAAGPSGAGPAPQSSGGQSRDICPPRGNCWRPAWSKDSQQIAFYSDAEARHSCGSTR